MNAGRRTGQVRIIGGDWRGRKLAVPDRPGLRPTGDRARETLFNWLQGRVAGRRAADLFAGSGALGLEAASRGAARVDLVERDRSLIEGLKSAVAAWPGAERVSFAPVDAMAWLALIDEPLDLVFVDPPFDAGLHAAVLDALSAPGRLAPDARVYVESDRRSSDPLDGRDDYDVLREKILGDVRLQLLTRTQEDAGRAA
ncbi:16S rRNA (guanine(966)-N(2))-methyltransferase RsmD [Halomonas denitrificans]|nr:16S rRNA (guanine(966)-N(2))-methyltransferase RsmD [Halomonas denitrificans]